MVGSRSRAFRIVAAAAVSLSAAAVPVFAGQGCKPVVGHFEAFVVPPGEGHCPPDPNALCTAGRVWGGIQGNYQFVVTGMIPAAADAAVPSTVFFFTGKSTVFLKSGDQVLGTDTGALDLAFGGFGGFASLITFSGGTGAMTAATGQIRLRGELDPAAGTTAGDYTGTLCRP